MSSFDSLPTPALLLDLDVLERNLARMARRAETLGVRLRPHVKTHKCPEIGELQRKNGAAGLTVSTLYEAETFANAGFDDLTWAFPVILSRVDAAVQLARRVKLGLVVDSEEAITALSRHASDQASVCVWIKVDCGYHRAGVEPESDALVRLASAIVAAPGLSLEGILTHSGHAYYATDGNAMRAVAEQERSAMVTAAGHLRAAGIDVENVSVGSTPAMSVVESLAGVTEARPGNYAFYDYDQCALGSCAPEDCAVTVLSSVVSKMPHHSVVDAGALAMSQDPGPANRGRGMGPIRDLDGQGALDPTLQLTSLSQEHGILNRPLAVGTRLRIVPNHSCLTVACFDQYHVVRGSELIDRWKIWRGR